MDKNINKKEKDISDIILKKEKRANWLGKRAVVFLLIGLAILWSDRMILSLGLNVREDIVELWTNNLFLIFYFISTCLSFFGFCIGRTKMTKAIFMFEILFPIAIVVGLGIGYLLLYILFYPLIQLAWGSM